MKWFTSLPTYQQVLVVVAVLAILWGLFCRGTSYNIFAGSRPEKFSQHRVRFEGFDNDNNNTRPSLVMFYAPWCGHCKTLKPKWEELMADSDAQSLASISKVDCDANKDMAQKYGISGFPTIKFFPRGMSDINSAIEYQGDRSIDGFKNFIRNNVSGKPDKLPDQAGSVNGLSGSYDGNPSLSTVGYLGRKFDNNMQ
jgi:protein disulfide-isomerase-like protein